MEAVKNLPPSVCSNSFLKKCVSHDRLKSFYFQNSSPKLFYSGYTKLVYNGYTTTLRSSKMPIITDKVSDHGQEEQIRSIPFRGRSRVIADDVYKGSKDALLSNYCKMANAVAAAALIMLQSCSPVCAEEVVITFPGSNVQEVNTVQRTLVEAWGIVRESYVDPTFNKQDWDLKLRETMAEILPLKTADVAYSKIKGMLATLGDPFTRIVSPKEYESFRISNDGSLQGVGLLLGTDRSTGRLVVLSSIEGGPAARAGILTGDEIVQINDEVVKGANGEDAASKLRGQAGTSVSLTLRRQVPNGSLEDTEIKEIKLQRETISLSPVFTARLPHFKSDGHMMQTGYIRLSTFSQNAAADMRKAISELENDKVESYILDLRNNPGGLVRAGLDVAQMWLDGDETLVNTIDRDGTTFPINIVNGHALTHDPLVVLVNEGSASATEILAGALHDNGRAILVGKKTFGKGKIQSVSELRDGSALFVTVAKYLSPSFHQIDQVGIVPDVQCSSDDMLNLPRVSRKSSNQEINSSGANALVATLEDDSCILTAEHELDLF